jgi:D-alanyl-D-alanine carboxypeptidase
MMGSPPYSPDVQAAARAGTLLPKGQRYGYGIIQISWGPNTIYFHGGEIPGFNSFMGYYDPDNRVTLVVWTNLTVSLDEKPTANILMLKVLDQIYVVSPFRQD